MGRRKLLTYEQHGELRRLYAEGGITMAGLGERFGIGASTAFRYLSREPSAAPIAVRQEEFIDALGPDSSGKSAAPAKLTRGEVFKEFGVSGLQRFGGTVQEDYLQEWSALSRMVPLVKRMMDNPTISAILFAVEMTIRSAEWSVQPASEEKADADAAEFLESCVNDMSHTFDEHVVQALTMIPFGFSPFEIVYKRRRGPDKEPASSLDDGLIGWRKLAFRSPDTLAPGDEWVFDEAGGVQGLNQTAPPSNQKVTIPIEKMLLYRTTSAKNNPQGHSALRGAYIPWYFAKNLAEVEAISAERMGAGIPVIYLGKGTTKSGATSDFTSAKKAVRDLAADEQAGIVFPHPQQTTDGEGVLFELVSPPSRGIVDFHQVIERYNQQMAQTLLAQFIFLGLTQRGTQALAVRSTDFFTQAIDGWTESIAQVFNLFAVPRLFRINSSSFPGITDYPKIVIGPLGTFDVTAFVEAVKTATDAGALTRTIDIERAVRQALELPEPDNLEELQKEAKAAGEQAKADALARLQQGKKGDTDLGEDDEDDAGGAAKKKPSNKPDLGEDDEDDVEEKASAIRRVIDQVRGLIERFRG